MSAREVPEVPSSPNKGGRPRRTDWQEQFLVQLALHGILATAARACRVSTWTVREERARDEDFSRRYDDAVEESTAGLELAAYTWARGGLTLKTVRTRTLKDGSVEKTEVETLERSPAMTIFMLKARRPLVYRDRLHVEADEHVTVHASDEETDAAVDGFTSRVVRIAEARRAREGAARDRSG